MKQKAGKAKHEQNLQQQGKNHSAALSFVVHGCSLWNSQVSRAFIAARALSQGLATGRDIVNKATKVTDCPPSSTIAAGAHIFCVVEKCIVTVTNYINLVCIITYELKRNLYSPWT